MKGFRYLGTVRVVSSAGGLVIDRANQRAEARRQGEARPGHCDPTVNLYDWYVAVRGDRVEAVWPITARGAIY